MGALALSTLHITTGRIAEPAQSHCTSLLFQEHQPVFAGTSLASTPEYKRLSGRANLHIRKFRKEELT